MTKLGHLPNNFILAFLYLCVTLCRLRHGGRGVGAVPWPLHSYNSPGGYPLTGHKAEGFLPYTLPLPDTAVTPKNDLAPSPVYFPWCKLHPFTILKKEKSHGNSSGRFDSPHFCEVKYPPKGSMESKLLGSNTKAREELSPRDFRELTPGASRLQPSLWFQNTEVETRPPRGLHSTWPETS